MERSGNPGYLRGKPVLGGVLEEQLAGDAQVPEGDPPLDSLWGMGEVGALSTMGLPFDGECFKDGVILTKRLPILFGSSARIGCSFSISRSTLANDCPRLKNVTMSLLTGPGGVYTLRKTRAGILGEKKINMLIFRRG